MATSVLRKILIRLSGNRIAQGALERNVRLSHVLMGIGSGEDVRSSGEASVIQLLETRSGPPYCVFDVGANKGQFLRLLLDNLGTADREIHCFEPSMHAFKVLEATATGAPGVTLNHSGLAREPGYATLHFDAPGSGLASLTKRRLGHMGIEFRETEQIELTTIDQYCSARDIDRIHLLKLDIEGHELGALSGGEGMFRRKAIGSVLFEFGGCNIDTRTYLQDYWYFFQDKGMQLFRITPSGYLRRLWSYREIDEQFRTTNLVAISR